jgi:hypothetical protein
MQGPELMTLQELVTRRTLSLPQAVQVLRELVPLVAPDTIIYPGQHHRHQQLGALHSGLEALRLRQQARSPCRWVSGPCRSFWRSW